MAEWSLSVSVNHLFASVIHRYANEKQGDEKNQLLYEAISQCEKVINLDQGESDRTAQAKMTMCFCLFDLKRYKEAEKIAIHYRLFFHQEKGFYVKFHQVRLRKITVNMQRNA